MKSDVARFPSPTANRNSSRRVLWRVASLLAVVAVVGTFGLGLLAPRIARGHAISYVAYCADLPGGESASNMKVALYQMELGQSEVFAQGETDFNGCGSFNYIEAGSNYVVKVWDSEGGLIGASDEFAADAANVLPTIHLVDTEVDPAYPDLQRLIDPRVYPN